MVYQYWHTNILCLSDAAYCLVHLCLEFPPGITLLNPWPKAASLFTNKSNTYPKGLPTPQAHLTSSGQGVVPSITDPSMSRLSSHLVCNLFQAEAPLAEAFFFSHQGSPGEIPISLWISLFQQSDTVRAKGVSLDCLYFFQACYGCGRRLQLSRLHSSRNGTGQVYTGSQIFCLDLNTLTSIFQGSESHRDIPHTNILV